MSIAGTLTDPVLGDSSSRQHHQQGPTSVGNQDHTYIRGHISTRGPCPGLNALANQGYLPRDGKNMTVPQVQAALINALHMSKPLARTLANQLKPLLHADGTFDLVDMRRHNFIERDVSFTRLAFRQGDNYTFQPHMFDAMIADTPDGTTTIETLAKTYRRREREEKATGAPMLPLRLYVVSLVQTISFLHTAEVGGRLDRDILTEFYTQERFPAVILENPKTRRLRGLVGATLKLLYQLMFKVRS